MLARLHSFALLLALLAASDLAHAQQSSLKSPGKAGEQPEAQPVSTLRAPTDPSVSPPLTVDPGSLQGLHEHPLIQQKVGFYAALVPPGYDAPKNRGRSYQVVVILHGGASSEIRHGKLADAFGRDDVIYVVPRAAYPNEPVILNEKRIAWSAVPTYPQVWGDKKGPLFPAAEVDALDVPGLYIAWIEQVLADARSRYRISHERALVIGHSQGGQFAHLLALRRPALVKAYFAYAGLFDATTSTPDDPRSAQLLKEHGIQPYLVHHENDERVPVKQTRDLDAYLAKYQVKHSTLILKGGDHMLDDEVHRAARRFVAEQKR